MNLQIINGYAGTDPGLLTAGTDPDRRYTVRLGAFHQPPTEFYHIDGRQITELRLVLIIMFVEK